MSGSSSPLSLAILGCGEIAAAHARTLAGLGDAVRYGFASRDRRRAESFAARHGGQPLGTYEEATTSQGVDAVVVTTPPSTHLPHALAALRAGKDVVVEKPAFLSTEEFDTALAAQEESGRRLLVAENYFYKPLRAKLEALISGAAVGRPIFFAVDATKRQSAEGWRADPAVGGGPLLEGGVHWVDLMANVGLEVTGARGVPMGEDPMTGRSVLATFAYAGGAAGELRFSWDAHAVLGGVRLSHLHGTEGTLTFESNGAFLVARGRRRAVWVPRPADAAGFRPMWHDFLAALRGDRYPVFTPAHARRDIELVEQIRGSLAQAGT